MMRYVNRLTGGSRYTAGYLIYFGVAALILALVIAAALHGLAFVPAALFGIVP